MNRCLVSLSGALVLAATLLAGVLPQARADILTGAAHPVTGEIERLRCTPHFPPSEIFDFDTTTGQRSRIQQFTQRGSGQFTAMDRDGDGNLWAIQYPNRLVRVNEETGYATDVAELTDGTEACFHIPAIAFFPGEAPGEEILVAIVYKDGVLDMSQAAPVIDDGGLYPGFSLAFVDIATGHLEDTEVEIGGTDDEVPVSHGLDFDPFLGLVHLWVEDEVPFLTEGKDDANEKPYYGGPILNVEVIDPETGEVLAAAPAPLPATDGGDTVGKEIGPSMFPSSVDAVVYAEEPGIILVLSPLDIAPDVQAKAATHPAALTDRVLWVIEITPDGPPVCTSEAEPSAELGAAEFYFTAYPSVGVEAPPFYGPRVEAMELGEEGELLIQEFGYLNTYDEDLTEQELTSDDAGASMGYLVIVDSVEASVGGFSPYFQSLVTDPVTGTMYALGQRGGFLVALSGSEQAEGLGLEPETGLFVIDRGGPAQIELDQLDVVFTDPGYNDALSAGKSETGEFIMSSPLTNVVAVAFDDEGVLYGVTSYGHLVMIDLATGIVTEIDGFSPEDLTSANYVQLEYNPLDGKLYLLYTSFESGTEVRLACVNLDGTGFTNIYFTGSEFPLDNPNSLVFSNGQFFFTHTEVLAGLTDGKESGIIGLGSQLRSTLADGLLSDVLLDFPELTFTALTLPTGSIIPDVLVGNSRKNLKGDDIYSGGRGQRIRIQGKRKVLCGEFFARVENDGSSDGVIRVRSSGGKKSDDITYYANKKNVTGAFKRGYAKSFKAGDSTDFRVTIKRSSGKRLKTRFTFRASAEDGSDTGQVDFNLKAKKPKDDLLKPPNLN